MFEFLKKIFRTKRSEIEAKLAPTPDCTWGGVGEIEIESWSDGAVQVEASIKHSGAPDGTELEAWGAGHHLAGLTVRGGYAKAYVSLSADALAAPIVSGDEAEFRSGGDTMYRGAFRSD
jgi:hypothetical protein